MKDTFRLLVLLSLLAISIVWLGSPRIFVIPPVGQLEKGATTLVLNAEEINFIDSPNALCERAHTPNYYCQCSAADRIMQGGRLLLTLPFSQALYDFTGAKAYEMN